MKNLPTANQLAGKYGVVQVNGHIPNLWTTDLEKLMIEFAKLHVQACKKAIYDEGLVSSNNTWDEEKLIDQCYPLTNIK